MQKLCGTWCLLPSWGGASDTCLATPKLSGVYHLGLERMWAQLEKLLSDSLDAKASTKNARSIGLHLAHIAWSLLDTDSVEMA